MRTIAEKACELLAQKTNFVLASIISRQGSTPRTAGTQMILSADGKAYGTIGGGVLEARVMIEAGAVLSEGRGRIMHVELTSNDIAAMDMICGGRVEVLLSPITAVENSVAVFNRWLEALSRGENCLFLNVIQGAGSRIEKIYHCLMLAGGTVLGDCPLLSNDLENIARAARGSYVSNVVAVENAKIVVIPAPRLNTLYVFGAGHVAQPTVRLAACVGFQAIVLDDREEFASAERFPDAHEVRVIKGFDDVFTDITVNSDTFVVILTRGHLFDRTVLSQALRTNAAYVGMIGSRRKRDEIFNSLRQEGFSEADLGRVHSPIGVEIGAESPAEIAVSIVAELIRVRSGS